MDDAKRKKIEAQLRQLLADEYPSQKEDRPVETRPAGVRVIRRRKGAPDKKIV